MDSELFTTSTTGDTQTDTFSENESSSDFSHTNISSSNESFSSTKVDESFNEISKKSNFIKTNKKRYIYTIICIVSILIGLIFGIGISSLFSIFKKKKDTIIIEISNFKKSIFCSKNVNIEFVLSDIGTGLNTDRPGENTESDDDDDDDENNNTKNEEEDYTDGVWDGWDYRARWLCRINCYECTDGYEWGFYDFGDSEEECIENIENDQPEFMVEYDCQGCEDIVMYDLTDPRCWRKDSSEWTGNPDEHIPPIRPDEDEKFVGIRAFN